jgi:hypothetical protein
LNTETQLQWQKEQKKMGLKQPAAWEYNLEIKGLFFPLAFLFLVGK